ncbi:acyltransferase family protein [Bifidobacterium jacchi]|uniref:acyltransferase family protein n=1 Tax=Bifidobacterium jacchi TaxID=2490545 RepID=UPI001F4F988F|nr:acyltransferase family protein [Bifidobacterium jacchi]
MSGKASVGDAQRSAGAATAHINGIDGLRALAIIAVIAFHTRPSLLEGGFIGVTMFFVITGFLITGSVVRAVDGHRRFDYAAFVGKRVRRLWPPTLATIAIVAPLCWLVSPSLLPKVQSDALPHALFVGNWTYILRKLPYFEAAGLPSPLTHLWFLGVTMQFYLIWPLIVYVLCRLTASRLVRGAVVATIMIASCAAMWLLFDPADTSRVYYGTDTRLAEFAAGALLAMIVARPASGGADAPSIPQSAEWRTRLLDAAATAALVGLAAAAWLANGYRPTMYHGGYLIAAIACMLVLAGVATRGTLLSRALGCRPLRYVGSRSFSLYLMHYPLLAFMNPATRTTALPWWGWLLEAAVIWAAGELFYQIVERMTNHMRRLRRARQRRATVESGTDSVTYSDATRHGTAAEAAAPAQTRRERTAIARASRPRLRIGAKILSGIGTIVVMTLAWAPVNWASVAQQRAIQLRPELAQPVRAIRPRPVQRNTDKPAQSSDATGDSPTSKENATAKTQQSETAQNKPQPQPKPEPVIKPIAEKAPNNLDPSAYTYDEATQSCSADVMMVGDSVTSGSQPAIQAVFPNAFIDGLPKRQITEAMSVYQQDTAAGHTGSVVIFALGTNGLISSEQQVQQLIDLTGGKPTYLVTVRLPYPYQVSNNNTMLRKAAANNANVGIIDWYAVSEGHGEYLYDDGIHPNMTGAYVYADMLRKAVCGR